MAISQKARKERVIKAMQDLSLSRHVVLTVLENLLEVYENHWTLIECEGYRALADTVLECQEQDDQQNRVNVSKQKAENNEKGEEEEEEEDEGGEDDKEEEDKEGEDEEEEEDKEGEDDEFKEDKEWKQEEIISEEEKLLELAVRPIVMQLIIREPDSSSFRATYEADSSDLEETLFEDPEASSSNTCIVNTQSGYESTVLDDDKKDKRISLEELSRSSMRASIDAFKRESDGIKRALLEESSKPRKK